MNEWVIGNASRWISGKPSLQQIIKTNNYTGTIMVCKRKTQKSITPIFVLGSSANYGNLGDRIRVTLDSGNGHRDGGLVEIENIISISQTDIIGYLNNIGLTDNRPLYVFK
jgi:hypothetical protein